MWVIWTFSILNLVQHLYCISLPREFVDLTYVFDSDTTHNPVNTKFQMKTDVNITGEDYVALTEEYTSGTHVGTHMDAPFHFIPDKWAIDQIPVDRFIAPAAVVNIESQCKLNPEYGMTVDDLLDWEHKTGQLLNNVILLMRTGYGKYWGNKTLYFGTDEDNMDHRRTPGMAAETAHWLVDNRNIFGIGTDAYNYDKGSAEGWDVHRILLRSNIYGLENVANVDKLPLWGAMLYVFPMKIGSGSGAPTRIIATYPKVVYE